MIQEMNRQASPQCNDMVSTTNDLHVPRAGDVHSHNFIPVMQKGGLLTVDIGQDCSGLNVAVPYKTPLAPVAKPEA